MFHFTERWTDKFQVIASRINMYFGGGGGDDDDSVTFVGVVINIMNSDDS